MTTVTAGDRVTWTHSRKLGRGFTFSTREGKVIHASERNIAVKYRGEIVNLRPDHIRTKGQTTELTEMVMGESQ